MIKIVDVFAGPGGLNEGFSKLEAVDGSPVFQVAGSFEVDPIAVETLKFRAAAREVGLLSHGAYRDFLNSHWSIETLMRDRDFAEAHARAGGHVYELRLGAETRSTSDELIRKNLNGDDRWVLVGGPPCQAYSLVGRSRMGHLETFVDDERHFLFKEYLHIIREHRPTVFVMENVKGLLSATHRGTRMFDRIMEDLSCGGEYEIRSFVVPGQSLEPRDYVIRSEDFGVPQRRHRVILLGLRVDQGMREPQVLKAAEVQSSLRHAVGQDLPALRSKVSPLRDDSPGAWVDARRTGAQFAGIEGRDAEIPAQYSGPERYTGVAPAGPLGAWLRDPRQEYVLQHEPRSHMRADLERYSYLANMAAAGEHPTLRELPADLLPNHRNVDRQNTPFVDRFKVQAWNRPSSTIVSHISKDGHHFIHPDPAQVRSLTVREAARLQTFPDDYFFMGNRTQQYHQVGNAVPPYLANQVAQVVANLMRN